MKGTSNAHFALTTFCRLNGVTDAKAGLRDLIAELIRLADANGMNGLHECSVAMTNRLSEVARAPVGDDREAIIAAARDQYADDGLEIDDGAWLSESEDGVWVQAWVLIESEEEVEEESL